MDNRRRASRGTRVAPAGPADSEPGLAPDRLRRAIEAARLFLSLVDGVDLSAAPTLEASIAEYEAEHLPGAAASTRSVYASWLRVLRRCTVDGRPLSAFRLDELSPAIARRVFASLSSTPYNGAQVVGLLRRVVNHAIESGRFAGPNPVRGFRGPRVRRRENPFDEESARRVRLALEDPEVGPAPARLLVRFLLLSGWRIGEARRLRVEDVHARTFDGNRFAIVELPRTKGGPQRREVAGSALSVLLCAAEGRRSGPVFAGRGGRPVGVKAIRSTLAAACERAAVDRRVPHDLRHTMATFLLRRGVARADVSRLLGHTDERTTLRYSHSSTTDVRAALRLVDQLDEGAA